MVLKTINIFHRIDGKVEAVMMSVPEEFFEHLTPKEREEECLSSLKEWYYRAGDFFYPEPDLSTLEFIEYKVLNL